MDQNVKTKNETKLAFPRQKNNILPQQLTAKSCNKFDINVAARKTRPEIQALTTGIVTAPKLRMRGIEISQNRKITVLSEEE